MFEKIKQLYMKYKEIINYLIFGVLATIVNLGVKYLLIFTVFDASNPLELQTTVIISWMSAVLFAYFTNRKYVFESKNQKKFKEFVSFIVARLLTLFLEMFVTWFFITFLELNSNIQVIIFTLVAQALVIIGNYIFSKLFVFRKEKK